MLIGGKIGMKLITAAKLQDYSQPDPYMIEANGKFYIYATGDDGVNVYRSDDLFGGGIKQIQNRRRGRKEGILGSVGNRTRR